MTGRIPILTRLAAPALVLLGGSVGCYDDGGNFSFSALSSIWKAPEPRSVFEDDCAKLPNEAVVVEQMLDAVNAERAKLRLPPVKLSRTLSDIADFYACRLIDGGFFDHVDPYDGSTVGARAADFAYAYEKAGENLAHGHLSVEDAMAAWMASPVHREIILDPAYTEAGFSLRVGGEYSIYWVQEFGCPLAAASLTRPTTQATVVGSENGGPTEPASRPADAEPIAAGE